MKPVVFRKFGLRVADAWFLSQSDWGMPNVDLIRAHCCPDFLPESDHIRTEQKTLVTDLTLSEEEIFSRIDKKFRYEIRRGEKEMIQTRQLDGMEICRDFSILNRFRECFDEMISKKGLKQRFNVEVLRKYARRGILHVSVAYLDGDPAVYHSYVDDGRRVRCWHSCSIREDSGESRAIGRANRLLHWNDIRYFKDRGFTLYDWGGIFDLGLTNGIDHFKASFGGIPETRYRFVIAVSPLGRLYLRCVRLRNGLRWGRTLLSANAVTLKKFTGGVRRIEGMIARAHVWWM